MSSEKSTFLIGAHMSIKGGFGQAIKDGAGIGCKAIQFFTKSNRQWYAKKITEKDSTLLNNALEETNISRKNVVVHASYLINLASGNKNTVRQSYAALLEELERCALLNLPYLVLHPGSATGIDAQDALAQITYNLEEAVKSTASSTMILLENMAGQGNVIGKSFEELAFIINGLSVDIQKKVGICIDTCHLFAAGISFATYSEYKKMCNTFDELIGLSKIKVIHLNDSKTAFGSHVDRHEHITKGTIPLDSFKLILQDELFVHVPKILETPYGSLEDHANNIQKVKLLYKYK